MLARTLFPLLRCGLTQVKSLLEHQWRRDTLSHSMAPNKGKFDTPRSGYFAMLKVLAESSEFAKNMLLKATTERTTDKP